MLLTWLPQLMGAGSVVALLVVFARPHPAVFITTASLWLLFLVAGEWYAHRAGGHYRRALPVLLVTGVAYMGLLSIIEWPTLLWLLSLFGGVTIFVLFRILITEGTLIHIAEKSLRRLMMLLLVFDAYALVTTGFALGLFFPRVPFWLLTLICGAIFAYVAAMIWSMYYSFPVRQHWLWLALMALFMIEVSWVVHLLPFGYLASGFFVTWVWYLLQLFIRFHFGHGGVIWKKQLGFLIANVVLFTLVLMFFVRWV